MSKTEKKSMRGRLFRAYASLVISISLVLLLFGAAALLVANARSVSDYFKESLQMSVMMRVDVNEAAAEEYRAQLDSMPFIHSTKLVTRAEGEKELKSMLGEDFLSVFETSPIPVSIDLTLKSDYVSSDSVAKVSAIISSSPLVDEVECRQSLIDALNRNLAKVSVFLGVFIVLLLFISTVLISNTVRLNVFAHRFSIHTKKLVGATRAFIRKPFMRDAVWQGLLASLIADAEIVGLLYLAKRSFPQLFEIFQEKMVATVLAGIVIAGVLICVVSTFFIVNKYISLNKDQLYG